MAIKAVRDGRITISPERMLKATPRGHKLLVPDDMPTDEAIYRLQLFILKHCGEIQAENREANLAYHGLRHTCAVLSLQNGDDIKTVQINLGHATAALTLDVYGHVSEKMKEDSAARMQAYISSVSDP